jgi:hypothetical protein
MFRLMARTRPRTWQLLVAGSLLSASLIGMRAVSAQVTSATTPAAISPGPILVVGDSLVVQAATSLRALNSTVTPITVAAAPGSAPCDFAHGYLDPFSDHYLLFSQIFNAVHPTEVVFAFSGNPGLGGAQTGCIDATTRYPFTALLENYQTSLTHLATFASKHGSYVYFSAAPPRNPVTPLGSYIGNGGQDDYGFNGDPSLNALFRAMSNSALGKMWQWRYVTWAAAAVSTPDLTWRLTEPCRPWDARDCTDGQVRVRAGGRDAIHLDTLRAGSIRYAMGLLKAPLSEMGLCKTVPEPQPPCAH